MLNNVPGWSVKCLIPKGSVRAGGTHLAILARTLASYLSVSLEGKDLERVSGLLNKQTAKIILSIFKMADKDHIAYYHDDPKDGLVRAILMALYRKCSNFVLDGPGALHSKPPVIYIADSGNAVDSLHACSKLGLPLSTVSYVPCISSAHTMDVGALDKRISDDIDGNKTPLLVIAYAGTPLAGHIDHLQDIRDICSKHKLWLHVTGHALSSMCLPVEDSHVGPSAANFPPKNAELTDGAILLPRVTWNGLQPQGVSSLHPLCPWLCIQYLGVSALIETVTYCSSLVGGEWLGKGYTGGGVLERPNDLTLPPPTPPTKRAQPTTSDGAGTTQPSSGVHSDQVASSSDPTSGQPGSTEAPVSDRVVVPELAKPTADVANMLIAKELFQLFPKVGVNSLKLSLHGVSFKFDPINSFPEHSTSLEDVNRFADALAQKVRTMHATALVRGLIERVLRGQPNLRCLEFPSFFASGFIQYVPKDWADKAELTLEEVSHLNSLNIELTSILSGFSPVFQPFQHGNFTCIMIKEVPENMDVFGLLMRLMKETEGFEENKKFLAGMAEKIRKGIEAATEDLSKEKERKVQEEGILRHVPIIGSVISWLSPSTPTTPDGRTFRLTEGKVETTAQIYRHKMQLENGGPPTPKPASDSAESTPKKMMPDSHVAEARASQSDKVQQSDSQVLEDACSESEESN
eukprot:Em0020g713a